MPPNTEVHTAVNDTVAVPSAESVLQASIKVQAQEQNAHTCGTAVDGIADADKGPACIAHHFCAYHDDADKASCIRRCSWDAEKRACVSMETAVLLLEDVPGAEAAPASAADAAPATAAEAFATPKLAIADADASTYWRNCSYEQQSLMDEQPGRCLAANVVLVRVPKSGSTSFGSVVRRIGSRYGLNGTHGDVPLQLPHPQVWSGIHKTRRELEELAQPAFRETPTVWVTLVRNPIDKALSQYYFYVSTHKNFKPSDETMKEFLLSGMHHETIEEKTGRLPRSLLTQYDFLIPPGKESIQDVLAAYDVLGTVERFEESVLLLRHRLNLSVCDVAYLVSKNSTENEHLQQSLTYEEQPPAMKAFLDSPEYRAHLGQDIELHRAVDNHMNEAIAKIGRATIDEELRQLRGILDAAAVRCPWSDEALPSNHTCLWHDQGCQYRCLNKMCRRLASGASLGEVVEEAKQPTGAAHLEAVAEAIHKRLEAKKAEEQATKEDLSWGRKLARNQAKIVNDTARLAEARALGNVTAVAAAEAKVAETNWKIGHSSEEKLKSADALRAAQGRVAEAMKEVEAVAQEGRRSDAEALNETVVASYAQDDEATEAIEAEATGRPKEMAEVVTVVDQADIAKEIDHAMPAAQGEIMEAEESS